MMLTEDKERFDLFQAGINSMGLQLRAEPGSKLKCWFLYGNNRPLALIFYEPNKPFNERFSFQSVRSRQES